MSDTTACAGHPLCCCAMAAALAEGQGTVLSRLPGSLTVGQEPPQAFGAGAWHEAAEKVPARGAAAAKAERSAGAAGSQREPWLGRGLLAALWAGEGCAPPRAAPWAGWAPAARPRALAALRGVTRAPWFPYKL